MIKFGESFSLGSLLNQYQTYQGNPCGVYLDLSSFTGSGVIQKLYNLYQVIHSYSGSHHLVSELRLLIYVLSYPIFFFVICPGSCFVLVLLFVFLFASCCILVCVFVSFLFLFLSRFCSCSCFLCLSDFV